MLEIRKAFPIEFAKVEPDTSLSMAILSPSEAAPQTGHYGLSHDSEAKKKDSIVMCPSHAASDESVSTIDAAATGDVDNTTFLLQRAWGWLHSYSASDPSLPCMVSFRRSFRLTSAPTPPCIVHLTADTRYKLSVNGHRVSVGPARGSDRLWFYDTVDIGPFLVAGENEILVKVVRYPYSFLGAYTHARTIKPGFSLIAHVGGHDISTSTDGWECKAEDHIQLLQRLPYDTNLHNFETVDVASTAGSEGWTRFQLYHLDPAYGILSPWKLRPRMIPMPECTPVPGPRIRFLDSKVSQEEWQSFFSHNAPITLPPLTSHRLELEFTCHSTAYIRLTTRMLQAHAKHSAGESRLRMTYSEAYEANERRPGHSASKGIRDSRDGQCLRGPHDEYSFGASMAPGGHTGLVDVYEPFWWRTFRYIVFEIDVGDIDQDGLTLLKFEVTQTNYPLCIKAQWELGDGQVAEESKKLWDISVRTLRNCVFDGYSDCPFYEQLQYSQDTRSSALFHYCISGDNRLAKQAIHAFASSMLPGGLIQARYPAQVSQVITGYSLFWILQVCDNLLFFDDKPFARRYLSEVDAVLDFFHRHIGPHGLVEGLPKDHWLYVDWVQSWSSPEHGFSPGVPLAGRQNGIFTYFSMLYAYVLAEGAKLAHACGRPGLSEEYRKRRQPLIEAIHKHCFDGQFFTDSLNSVCDIKVHPYSQHCQVWGILCGAVMGGPEEERRILMESFYPVTGTPAPNFGFSTCSYPMWFYAYRAFSKVGMYDQIFDRSLEPWRNMLANHLTTWEEDPVTRRSDCHAWSSTYLYEAMTEVAGLKPLAPGWKVVSFAPRVALSPRLHAKFPLGNDQMAEVDWSLRKDGSKSVALRLQKAVDVRVLLPDGSVREEQQVTQVSFQC